MIYPTLDQLSKDGKYDRYTVTVAAAKGARMVTEEYVAERERAEMMVARKETDKSLGALIDKELRDEKAVKTAIRRIHDGEYVIVRRPEGYFASLKKDEEPVYEEPIDFKKIFAEEDDESEGEDADN